MSFFGFLCTDSFALCYILKNVGYNVGSVEKFLKEEVDDASARPYIGIRLSIINEVDEDSTKEKEDNKRNKTNNETTNHNEEARIGDRCVIILAVGGMSPD